MMRQFSKHIRSDSEDYRVHALRSDGPTAYLGRERLEEGTQPQDGQEVESERVRGNVRSVPAPLDLPFGNRSHPGPRGIGNGAGGNGFGGRLHQQAIPAPSSAGQGGGSAFGAGRAGSSNSTSSSGSLSEKRHAASPVQSPGTSSNGTVRPMQLREDLVRNSPRSTVHESRSEGSTASWEFITPRKRSSPLSSHGSAGAGGEVGGGDERPGSAKLEAHPLPAPPTDFSAGSNVRGRADELVTFGSATATGKPQPLPPPPLPDLFNRQSSSTSSRTSPSHSPTGQSPIHTAPTNWEQGKELGRGNFGVVYEGLNQDTGSFFAVKEVLIDNSAPKAGEIEKEVELLSRLHHPNIVQYLGTSRKEDKLYIFMELGKGSLHAELAKYGSFKESMIRKYTWQILQGLAYLHSQQTVHRDIKCANLLVDSSGQVKLADFGMAKQMTEEVLVHSMKGSPYWMAPEVMGAVGRGGAGHVRDHGSWFSADIWSLGCTIVEMADGKPPWSTCEGYSFLFRLDSGEVPAIPDHLSPEARDFLHLCFQHNPSARPSAADLLAHRFLSPLHSTVTPLRDVPRNPTSLPSTTTPSTRKTWLTTTTTTRVPHHSTSLPLGAGSGSPTALPSPPFKSSPAILPPLPLALAGGDNGVWRSVSDGNSGRQSSQEERWGTEGIGRTGEQLKGMSLERVGGVKGAGGGARPGPLPSGPPKTHSDQRIGGGASELKQASWFGAEGLTPMRFFQTPIISAPTNGGPTST